MQCLCTDILKFLIGNLYNTLHVSSTRVATRRRLRFGAETCRISAVSWNLSCLCKTITREVYNIKISNLLVCPKGFVRYTSGGDALFVRGQPETVCGPRSEPNTGRFLMFFVITNIYKKKIQRTYLNGIVHSHSKTEKVLFFTTRDVRCVYRG